VPIVRPWQRGLLSFARKHAQGKEGLLFGTVGALRQALRKACLKAGIDHASPNDLRRTYSTWMRSDGAKNEHLAPTMGHASDRMLSQGIYGRLPPDVLRALLAQATGTTLPARSVCQQCARPLGDLGTPEVPSLPEAPSEMAPRPGFEPGTHGLTVRVENGFYDSAAGCVMSGSVNLEYVN
jgi:hypothetical protein